MQVENMYIFHAYFKNIFKPSFWGGGTFKKNNIYPGISNVLGPFDYNINDNG